MSQDGREAAFYRRLVRRHSAIHFLWPSRGPDLRIAAQRLPRTARPFAVDRSSALDALTREVAGDAAPFAGPLIASALALQGMVLDAVDLPSTLPLAHLVRPLCNAFGIPVGRVTEAWLGEAERHALAAWPDPADEDWVERLAACARLSRAAVELRYGVGIQSPPCGNGAPSLRLSRSTLWDVPQARPGNRDENSTLFYPLGFAHDGLGTFLELVRRLPAPLRADARLPPDLPQALRNCLRADPIGAQLRPLSAEERATGVDCAGAALFDPVPLETLMRGERVILSHCGWTSAMLDEAGEADLAPQRIDPTNPDTAAATLSQMLTAAPPILLPQAWKQDSGADLLEAYTAGDLAPAYGVAAPLTLPMLRPMLDASRPWRHAAAQPEVTFLIAGTAMSPTALARTLASLARLETVEIEALVALDEHAEDPQRLDQILTCAGPFAAAIRQGRDAPLLPLAGRPTKPVLCVLAPGAATSPGLGTWLKQALAECGCAAALPACASVRAGQPSRAVAPSPAMLHALGGVPWPCVAFRGDALRPEDEGTCLAAPSLAAGVLDRLLARFGAQAIAVPAPDDPPLVLVTDWQHDAATMAPPAPLAA